MSEALNFKDLFKKSIISSGVWENINISDILTSMFIALILSLFILFIYRKVHSGVVLSHNMSVSMVLLSLITCIIIITVSTNLVLSLGMVGALSIIRFRTAIKDPLDIVFMFWSISIGISSGAKLYSVAIIGSLFIGLITLVLMRYKNSNNLFLIIIHYEQKSEEDLLNLLVKYNYSMKSKTANKDLIELTAEVKLLDSDTSFTNEIVELDGVSNVSLVSYNGEFVR